MSRRSPLLALLLSLAAVLCIVVTPASAVTPKAGTQWKGKLPGGFGSSTTFSFKVRKGAKSKLFAKGKAEIKTLGPTVTVKFDVRIKHGKFTARRGKVGSPVHYTITGTFADKDEGFAHVDYDAEPSGGCAIDSRGPFEKLG